MKFSFNFQKFIFLRTEIYSFPITDFEFIEFDSSIDMAMQEAVYFFVDFAGVLQLQFRLFLWVFIFFKFIFNYLFIYT